MSKLSKLKNNPTAFFFDAIKNRITPEATQSSTSPSKPIMVEKSAPTSKSQSQKDSSDMTAANKVSVATNQTTTIINTTAVKTETAAAKALAAKQAAAKSAPVSHPEQEKIIVKKAAPATAVKTEAKVVATQSKPTPAPATQKKTAQAESKVAAAPQKKTAQAESKATTTAPTKPVAAVAKTSAPAASNNAVVPDWFNPNPGLELTQALQKGKPIYLYIPWIAEHSNSLIAHIKADGYEIVPLDIFHGIQDNAIRRQIFRYARQYPELYRKMLVRRLVPLRSQLAGVIFTFDWAAIMRVLANVCEELEIPRVLIPHESVFVDRNKYYWDPTAQASIPAADIVLGWGNLQKEIFVERGYPAERILPVGAPKFDAYVNYEAKVSRKQFHRLFGLDASRKTILFASQPLDSQLDTKVARESQRQAISDLFEYAKAHDHQLLVRMPPSKDDILGVALRRELELSDHGAIDDAVCYLVNPEEALFHADLVTSVNSTMLFEGILAGKPALSMKYVEFDQIWSQVGIPAVTNAKELESMLATILEQPGWQPPAEGMAWAANMFSCGQFDGLAAKRIRDYLTGLTNGNIGFTPNLSAQERFRQQKTIDIITLNLSDRVLEQSGDRLRQLLNANRIFTTAQEEGEHYKLGSTELFVHWHGSRALSSKTLYRLQRQWGREVAHASPGFIHLGSPSPDKCVFDSIVIDHKGYHVDSTGPCAMLAELNGERLFSQEQQQQARELMARLRQLRVARCNNQPDLPIKLEKPEQRKLLVLAQASEDPAMGSLEEQQQRFTDMVTHVMRGNDDAMIIIKQGTALPVGNLLTESLQNLMSYSKNVHLLKAGIHSHALLDIVDEVYVLDDHFGFEALMAGKPVHCFGRPFYAGWGLTVDHHPNLTRKRGRSLEELFYISYIQYSRYQDPLTAAPVSLETLLEQYANKIALDKPTNATKP